MNRRVETNRKRRFCEKSGFFPREARQGESGWEILGPWDHKDAQREPG